jgi:hypothetical protein
MAIKYVGDGEFLSGIPARDLTEAEWESLSKEQQKAALNSGLYEKSKPKKTAKRGD